MEIKIGDKFEDINEGIYLIIDKIIGNQIYHHTIGKVTTIPNSEIKRFEIFEWMISKGVIRKV
jgi:hypothetical protein